MKLITKIRVLFQLCPRRYSLLTATYSLQALRSGRGSPLLRGWGGTPGFFKERTIPFLTSAWKNHYLIRSCRIETESWLILLQFDHFFPFEPEVFHIKAQKSICLSLDYPWNQYVILLCFLPGKRWKFTHWKTLLLYIGKTLMATCFIFSWININTTFLQFIFLLHKTISSSIFTNICIDSWVITINRV